MRVAVIGAGSWATALAVLLSRNGKEVTMWARRQQQIEEMLEYRENRSYLPGVSLPPQLRLTADLELALADAEAVVLGVPSHAVRETIKRVAGFLKPQQHRLIVNTAKGLEEGSFLRLSQVIASELPDVFRDKIVVLSGPSHAEEVGREIPTAVVAAAAKRETAEAAQDLFMSPAFRVYTNPDVVGVELGGALKNIIALCTGISDGLGFGDNTKAALMTRGLAEIARLGSSLGAQPLTFAGLAGVGDLIVTCTSLHSRNRRAGILIGQGKKLEEALAEIKMVVEGVRTCKVARSLAQNLGVSMPITEQAYQVLFAGADPREGVARLMQRGKTHEMEEVVLNQHW
ncbi:MULTISPECIES: NAD(P)H-dependent glycerol-3-phosphate dehydrogenase [Carboxydocella]|uniref:Glycerol-3-phosphate dehydrogenase [NAD(P)+] n=2 Tax=Carboxydocella TaxID=178898 RepID=A0A1T4RNG2_9FIRM|nr:MULTISPECIES: NAD(P)H-dependent glycerol-3-phosphate dehydrogenase [Carboxydocella]AVX20422.1 glycerol 3-phosphate dehydrogenase (NAD(P)+) [Carboxydocella thermautotrophica]AVX30844.1 glycerol 3-phosphate dehydrogenase (NAD(P)+) [Carboxydocella thermautotrophica]GAW32445.1 glycerol-3-phosphate dehydrogenase (NAD(P)(+)) [Carboxydocella sp. JDF658]SKA17524.1 glycerol 3-phosphate dehydrogenase (NAD(P)+) [Carboxydocella sporoproducens DSM 16521]